MNDKTYEFDALIEKVPEIDGAYVAFRYDIKSESGRGRVKSMSLLTACPMTGASSTWE